MTQNPWKMLQSGQFVVSSTYHKLRRAESSYNVLREAVIRAKGLVTVLIPRLGRVGSGEVGNPWKSMAVQAKNVRLMWNPEYLVLQAVRGSCPADVRFVQLASGPG